MRIFISDLTGYIGNSVLKAFKTPESEDEIVGSVSGSVVPKGVTETAALNSQDAIKLAEAADVIVVSLHSNPSEANAIVNAIREKPVATVDPDDDEEEARDTILIGVSTLLAWAASATPKNEERLCSEDNYKRRKPLPRLADLKTAETALMRMQRPGLKTFVVGAGVLYGNGEYLLHPLFKSAWLGESDALDAKNRLPMIHVTDLGRVVQAVGTNPPEEKQYLVAVDQAKHTLAQVGLAIAKVLGTGQTRLLDEPSSQAMLLDEDDGEALAALQIDLAFDLESAGVSSLEVEWVAGEGFAAHVRTVVKQFVEARNLKPVKVALFGPPCSGKSVIADKLATKHYVPVVRAKEAIDAVMKEDSKFKEAVERNLDAKPRLTTRLMARVVQSILRRPKYRNRGYVLDGYPRSYVEAVAAFTLDAEPDEEQTGVELPEEPEANENGEKGGGEAEAEEEDEGGLDDAELNAAIEEDEDAPRPIDAVIAPNAVVMLEASDDVLKQRLSSKSAENSAAHDTQKDFARRLQAYQDANNVDNDDATVVFFEKRAKVHSIDIDEGSQSVDEIVAAITAYIESSGKVANYHPNREELAEAKAQAEREADTKAAAEAKRKADEAAELANTHQEDEKRHTDLLDEVKQQEAELLEARTAPLRAYLVETVIPSLTEGLLQVSKAEPEDPVDFLASFLFKKSLTEDETRTD